MPGRNPRPIITPLTQEEKDAIIECGGEFFREDNDPYQALAERLGVSRDVAKSKYYQFLYTNIESVVARNSTVESYTNSAILDIVGAHGAVRREIMEEARSRADARYQDRVELRRRGTTL